MIGLRLGLAFARRRWQLTLLGILGVLVPVAGGGIAWIVDVSSRASTQQQVADSLGDSQALLTPEVGFATPAARQQASTEVSRILGGAAVQPLLSAFSVDARVGRLTRSATIIQKSWQTGFEGLLQVSSGRSPGRAGEVLLTPQLAREWAAGVGDSVSISGSSGTTVSVTAAATVAAKVVGIGVAPLSAGTVRVVFAAPGTLDPLVLESLRVEWVVAAPPSTGQLEDLLAKGVHAKLRSDFEGGKSLYGREPVLFAGLTLITLVALLAAARFLSGRARGRRQAVLLSLGAPGRMIAVARAVESVVAALIGVIVSYLLLLVVGGDVARAVATRVNHLPPDLGGAYLMIAALSSAAAALVVLAGFVEFLRRSPGSARARRASGVDVRPTPALIGKRLAAASRKRTIALFVGSGVVALAAFAVQTAIVSVATAAEQDNVPSWRQSDVTLDVHALDPPDYLVAQLATIVHGSSAVISRPRDAADTLDPGALFADIDGQLCRLTIVDTDIQWQMLTNTPPRPDTARALAAGQVVALTPQCRPGSGAQGGSAQVVSAPADNGTSKRFGTLRVSTIEVGPFDRYTRRLADAVVSSATVARVGLPTSPILLIARGNAVLDADMRAAAAKAVEDAGYPATDIRSVAVEPISTPVTLEVLTRGLWILLTVFAVTAALSVVQDERTTRRTLLTLGTRRARLAVPFLRATAPATAAGLLTGALAGLAAGSWWAMTNGIPVTWSIGWGVAGVLGVLALQNLITSAAATLLSAD